MPSTYTQIYLQTVFAVKHRYGLIQPTWSKDLYRYITGIVQKQEHKLLAVNGMPDHVHVFIGINPKQSICDLTICDLTISDLMQDIRSDSSKWINDNRLTMRRFAWQTGYGAFSYGHSQIDNVVKYIHNQQEHHQKRTFIDEYTTFLRKFNVPYDERYIFRPLEE